VIGAAIAVAENTCACRDVTRRDPMAGWAPLLVVSTLVLAPAPQQAEIAQRAYAQGYREGYPAGVKDGRHRSTPNPQRSSRFRKATHGEPSGCECRELYQREYRTGFLDGYQRGFAVGEEARFKR
jgi:hypothetical protein